MKRSIALFLVCICLLLAAVLLPAEWFLWNKLPSHWADKEIQELKQMGVSFPYARNQWDEVISRGELCGLLVSAFAADTPPEEPFFSDVPKEHPCFSVIQTACAQGWISRDQQFRPDDPLSRRELLLICNNLSPFETEENFLLSATDVEASLESLVAAAVQSGLFTLYEDDTFRPSEPITKAAAGSVICRLLRAENNEDGIRRALLLDYLHAFSEGKDASHLCTQQEAERQQYRTSSVLPFFQTRTITKTIQDLVLTLTQEGGTASFDVCFENRTLHGNLNFSTPKTEDGFLVADTQFQFVSPEPIRLVWEYASRPDMEYTNQNKASVVSPTWFKLIDEKEVEVLPKDAEITESLYLTDYYSDSFFQEAKKRNQQIWGLCSNGFSPDQTREVLSDERLRKKLIETLFTKAMEYQLDGINLDFENMYQEDKDLFTRFVQECNLYAKECGLVLSADITKIEESSHFYSMCYDRAALSRCTDYLMLMAYDQHPRGSKTAGPIAALDWTEAALTGVLEQVPSNQLLLGVPFYTRIWETENGAVTDAPAASMAEVQELITEKNLTTVWNDTEKLHYAEYPENNLLYKIWIEDQASLSARLDLINQYELAGIACWSGGYETPEMWDFIGASLK